MGTCAKEVMVRMSHRKRMIFAGIAAVTILAGSLHRLESDLPEPQKAGANLLTTLVRGLEHWEGQYEAIGGICKYETFVSEFQQKADSKLLGGKSMGPRSLDTVRFVRSGPRWQLEVVELVSNGINNWGFLHTLPAGKTGRDGGAPLRVMENSDGEKVSLIDYAENRCWVSTDNPADPGMHVTAHLLHHLFLLINRQSPSRFVKDCKSPSVEALETVEGTRCYRVADYQPKPDGNGGYMVAIWIAPDKGFAPIKFEDLFIATGDPINGQRYVTTCTEIKEVRQGLWLPMKVVHHVYGYYGDERQVWRSTSIVTVNNWIVNPPKQDLCFSPHIPLGTEVEEREGLEGSRHFVGDTDRELELFSPQTAPPPFDARRSQPLKSRDVRKNAWP